MDDETKKILSTVPQNVNISEITVEIGKLFISKGLSYRQACTILDYTKDQLKDAKIC